MTSEGEGDASADVLLNIVGDKVGLGPLRRDLLPVYTRWINDFRTLRTLGAPPEPMAVAREEEWFNRAVADPYSFTVYVRETLQPIGNTALHDVNFRHRTAEFGILIGEPDQRGKGYGTETARLMLDYAFTVLGLRNVMLKVYEVNLAGRRAYQKAGFTEFGRRRGSRFMGGRYWDEIYMDAVADDFASPVLAQVFAPDEPRARDG